MKHPFDSAQLKKRQRKSMLFKSTALLMVALALLFLVVFLFNIASKGYSAFTQSYIYVTVDFSKIKNNPRVAIERQHRRVISNTWIRNLPNLIKENPSLKNETKKLWALANSEADQYIKGHDNKLKSKDKALIERLKKENRIKRKFNTILFTHGDSQMPENSGFFSAIKGTIMTIIITMLVGFPIGVMTAIYLQEFAKDNRIKQFIEININNLAAVPSILFGLLGLAIFINFLGMPRASALVGGLTLGIMILPIIIVTAQSALRSVPDSIRQAGFAMGLTRWQVVRGFVLPLAMPGILTGSIISLAQAIGETAPLLLLGMITFMPDAPTLVTDATTVMSAQIYTWSSMPQNGYIERTSAAILILLGVMVTLNLLAITLRSRFKKRFNL